MSDTATPIPTPDTGYTPEPKESRTVSFWAGLIAAPMLWFVNLNVSYGLVRYVQQHPGRQFLLALSSILFFALCLGCGVVSVRDLRRRRHASDTPTRRRLEFMAPLAILSSLLFAVAIVAQFLTTFFFNPYWD
jgi:hypothetical protein